MADKEKYPVLLSYDISGKHDEVKAALLKLGYTETVISDEGGTVNLPYTTVHHLNKTTRQSRSDLQLVVEELREIQILRMIAIKASTWSAIGGEPYSAK